MANKTFFRKIGKKIKLFFTTNTVIKCLVVFFALLLWGTVLVYQNPVREKLISDVKIALAGSSDLQSRNLIVVSSDLGDCDVLVSSEITNHSRLNPNRITCTASLATVNEPGEYTLYLDANVLGNLGSVANITPAFVVVEVDSLITRTIAVRYTPDESELPNGYALKDFSIPNSVVVEGAARYIAPIAYAMAEYSLEGLTDDYYGAVDLVFYDASGNVLDVKTKSENNPNVNLRLTVVAEKTVPVLIPAESILPDSTYYDVNLVLNMPEVTIWGDAERLDTVEGIYIEPVSITTEANQTYTHPLVLPDGVTLKSGTNLNVRIFAAVTEHETELTFTLPVEFERLGTDYTVADTEVVITIRGTVLRLEALSERECYASCNLDGLTVGTHTVVLRLRFDFDNEGLIITAPEELEIVISAVPQG